MIKLNREKRIIIYICLAILVIVLGIISSAKNSERKITLSDEFVDSYENVLRGSQEVVFLTNNINDKIKEVNDLDSSNKKSEAILSINEANELIDQAKDEAFNLSVHLAEMVGLVSTIASPSTQTSALELVTIESTIVQEFLNYTIALEEFLNSLSVAINSNTPSDRTSINNQIENLNNKNNQINQLNQVFLSKSRNLGLLSRVVGDKVDDN
ncbi:MAG: hypothetical protein WD471_01125 [Candidatus Paceibacterota bacterium]